VPGKPEKSHLSKLHPFHREARTPDEGCQTGSMVESPGILLYNVNYRIYGLLWNENRMMHKAERNPDINKIKDIFQEVVYFCIIKK
jgi:hypothetical protein